jgi:asparagine synthase (glutamine-hydrolysing)
MCGIAGIIASTARPDAFIRLRSMTDAIIHRGPDGEGHWVSSNGHVGFGHRRLSIIDLSDNGRQPMHYAEGRYTITFNGEIYNYIEIKKELLLKGYSFVSDSDTEVLLALYDLKKEKCLEDLDGMFAFAIWDELDKTLFIARDRFGEKPLYYALENGALYFASEMKALWAAGVQRKVNEARLLGFIASGEVDNDTWNGETFYTGIKKLRPATYLLVSPELQVQEKTYWTLSLTDIGEGYDLRGVINKFEELFSDSIKLRMRSDVTVGTSLSGGLDSSYIVAVMNAILGGKNAINTFSAKFPGFERDESQYIGQVTAHLPALKPFEVFPGPEGLVEDFKKLCHHQEEPFQSASIYAQYKVFELARKHQTTVLLDGQGADEILAGYLPYYGDYLKQMFFWNRKNYRSELKAYNANHGDYAALNAFEKTETLRMRLGRYKDEVLKAEKPYPGNYMKQQLRRDLLGVNFQTLLRYADRNAMAHSVETRLPFLSHHLVEWVFTLPDHFLLHHGWSKYLMRSSAEKLLPADVVWRKRKVGYEPPQTKWLQALGIEELLIKAKKQFQVQKQENNSYTNSQDWKLLMAYIFTN